MKKYECKLLPKVTDIPRLEAGVALQYSLVMLLTVHFNPVRGLWRNKTFSKSFSVY